MQVCDSFKTDKLSDLNFGASALYLLASPSTPEPARLEAIERGLNVHRPHKHASFIHHAPMAIIFQNQWNCSTHAI